MKVTYLGTTVLLFDDGIDQIMFDAHFTRPSLLKFAFGNIESKHSVVDKIVKQYEINRLKAIFVSHTHTDHVLDVPYLASITNASIYGSYSAMNVAKGGNIIKDKLFCYDNNKEYRIGNFEIKVIPSLHSKAKWYNNDLGKTIDDVLVQPSTRKAFKEGGSYDFLVKHSNKTYLIRPSFNYIDGQLDNIKADVLYFGIGGMSQTNNSFRNKVFSNTIEKVNPKLIIPIHWDNFFKPLDEPSYSFSKILDDSEEAMHYLANYCAKKDIACLVQLPLTSMIF